MFQYLEIFHTRQRRHAKLSKDFNTAQSLVVALRPESDQPMLATPIPTSRLLLRSNL
jgi:hypothetical protein